LKDVTGHWAASSIQGAVEAGIVKGYDNGQFRPNQVVDRAEFVTMLVRALKLNDANVSLSFKDADKIPAWAQTSVAQASKAGIISGFEDGTFGPGKQLSRAELAVLIVRASGIVVDQHATLTFKDAKGIPQWAVPYIAAGVKAGLINGVGDNKFAPSQLATRAEATVLIMGMLNKK